MINFDITTENIKKHNPNWPQIPDHLYRILIIGAWGSGKTNSLFNVICRQTDVDKIFLYAKDPYEAKYQFLINKQESTRVKHFNDSKAFLNTQIIWMVFMKVLKNTILITNIKNVNRFWWYDCWLLFADCLVIKNLIQ